MPAARAPAALGAASKRLFRSFSCAAVAEIVEDGDAVGLGPHAHRPGAADVLVFQLDVALAVERYGDAAAGEFDAQNVPLAFRDRGIDILEGDAAAALRVVERNVIFQGIRAGHIVVVAVLPAPDDAAGLIVRARERFEFHLDVAVGDRNVALDAPRT